MKPYYNVIVEIEEQYAGNKHDTHSVRYVVKGVNLGEAERIRGKILTENKRGLKDHQIQQLVNAVRDAIKPLTPVQSLRDRVDKATLRYLQENNLRIDG